KDESDTSLYDTWIQTFRIEPAKIGGLDDLFADNERITNRLLCRPNLTNHHSTPSNGRRTPVEQYSLLNDESNVQNNGNSTVPQPQPPLHEVLKEIANIFKEATIGIAAATRPPVRETNLVPQNEAPAPRSRPNYQNHDPSRLTCYTCEEPRHVSRNCMFERNGGRNPNLNQNPRAQNNLPNNRALPPRNVNFYEPRNVERQNQMRPHPHVQTPPRHGNVNFCGLDEDGYEPEDELEAYITPMA
ncbi:8941_t:CDS:2, partial [Cetraspora pellucida]